MEVEKFNDYICSVLAGVAQLVERQPSKLNVAGSNPVSRSQKNLIEKWGFSFLKNGTSRHSGEFFQCGHPKFRITFFI